MCRPWPQGGPARGGAAFDVAIRALSDARSKCRNVMIGARPRKSLYVLYRDRYQLSKRIPRIASEICDANSLCSYRRGGEINREEPDLVSDYASMSCTPAIRSASKPA